MFDIFISSDELNKIKKDILKNNLLIKQIYIKIFNELIGSPSYDFDKNTTDLISSITHNYGYLYIDIITNILSYNCLKIIKKNNCGEKFIKNVISIGDNKIINLYLDFIRDYNMDAIDIYSYINNFIYYNNQNLSEQSNYCD